MLKHRILTAAILVPAFLVLLFYSNDLVWMLAIGAVCLVAWDEWLRLAGVPGSGTRIGWHLLLAGIGVAMIVIQPPITLVAATALLAWWFIILFALLYRTDVTRNSLVQRVIGILVLSTSWWMLHWLHMQWMGPWWVLLAMSVVWCADTGAYFAGRAWGKTRLAPEISPGKTVEGLVGGLFLALLVCGVAAISIFPLVPVTWLVPTLLVTVLASVCGDLYESTLKRNAGVKDSGSLLPGHGGMLDRIDAILGALPFFVTGLLMSGMLYTVGGI